MLRLLLFLALIFPLAAEAQPAWVPSGGTQTCNDNFTGTSLNNTTWSTIPGNGPSYLFNNGLFNAFPPFNYVMLNPGVGIVSKKQNFQMTATSWTNYTGSYIISRGGGLGCGYQQFGYWQSTLKQPPLTGGGAGQWSSFWMLPENGGSAYEVDIYENFGGIFTLGANTIQGHLLYNSYAGSVLLCQTTSADNWTGSHTYGVDIESGSIAIYIDGTICTSGANPTGTYTGTGVSYLTSGGPPFVLWDVYLSNLQNYYNNQTDALLPSALSISNYQVWQKTGNTQNPINLKVGNATFDKATYSPGDTANLSVVVTAGNTPVTGVTVTWSVFDFCGDNNSGFSPCMYPATNNTFGTVTGVAPVSIAANGTATLTATWPVPSTMIPGVYTLEYTAGDAASDSDSQNMRIIIGNPLP